MKKIFLAFVFLGIITACTAQTTGKLNYKTIRQAYKGDYVTTTLGADSVKIKTNLNYFDFNKPLYVNGVAVGDAAIVTTLDTMNINQVIRFYENGNYNNTLVPNAVGYTFNMPNSALTFNTGDYNSPGNYFNLLTTGIISLSPSDLLPVLAGSNLGMLRVSESDSSLQFGRGTTWSDISTGGGGTGSGTVATDNYQVAYGTADNTVGGMSSFTYAGDRLTVPNILVSGGLVTGSTLGGMSYATYVGATSKNCGLIVESGEGTPNQSTIRSMAYTGDFSLVATYVTSSEDTILKIGDKLYLDYLTTPTTYGYLYIDQDDKEVHADSSTLGASFGLKIKKSATQLLSEIKDNELEWTYAEGKTTYRLDTLTPVQILNAQNAMIETLVTAMADLEKGKESIPFTAKFMLGFLVFMALLLVLQILKK
jgi:hypothetical protein